jgi:two-component system response regulator FixJ
VALSLPGGGVGVMPAIKHVYVVDDDDDVRDTTALLLKLEGYEVDDFASASSFLKSLSAPYNGCVITDIRMPEMDGVELIAEMRKKCIPLPVIVVTAHADVPLAVQAMKLGAIDLLMKPFDVNGLLAALKAASNQNESEQDHLQKVRERLATLTDREADVLHRLLAGMGNKEIAHDLGISVRTAEVHRANIKAKTGAKGLAELIKMAIAADPRQLDEFLAASRSGESSPLNTKQWNLISIRPERGPAHSGRSG